MLQCTNINHVGSNDLTEDDFYKSKLKLGRTYYCKQCLKVRQKEYYSIPSNLDKKHAYQKKYDDEIRGLPETQRKRKILNTNYYLDPVKGPERLQKKKDANKRWYAKPENKEKIKEHRRKFLEKNKDNPEFIDARRESQKRYAATEKRKAYQREYHKKYKEDPEKRAIKRAAVDRYEKSGKGKLCRQKYLESQKNDKN